jgi:thiamine biosynthesis lipoprotein
MGTRFELVLACEDEPRWRAAGEAALECIEACDERWSLFSSSSLVARINREAARTPVRLDPELYELLERCLELRERYDGAFDVAIGRRMRALGFRGAPEFSQTARESFELDRTTRSIRFTTPETALDLGSIAKGHALDLAAQLLREHGVESGLLHGGTSSVIALGAPPDADAWRVRIGSDGAHEVRLRDAALSVSAPRGRTSELGSQTVGHIVDPVDGRPVPLKSRASVVAPSAGEADAASTAALVLHARGAAPEASRPHDQSWLVEDGRGDALVGGDPSLFRTFHPFASTHR